MIKNDQNEKEDAEKEKRVIRKKIEKEIGKVIKVDRPYPWPPEPEEPEPEEPEPKEPEPEEPEESKPEE